MNATSDDITPIGGWAASKHEIIRCDRCGNAFECKANSFTKCRCTSVQLTINETQFISESYDGCLCTGCLAVLRDEYHAMIRVSC